MQPMSCMFVPGCTKPPETTSGGRAACRDGFGSAEREAEGFDAGIEKLDLESAILDWPRLPDQLIRALCGDDALPLRVDIGTATHRLPVGARTRYRTEVPRATGPMTRLTSRA